MCVNSIRLFLHFLVLSSLNIFFRDKMYFNTNTVQCKILDITLTTVAYVLSERKAKLTIYDKVHYVMINNSKP